MNTCATILNNLFDYISLVKRIESIALNAERRLGKPDVVMVHAVSIAYNTIKLTLHSKDPKDKYSVLYFQAVFEITDDHGHCNDIYCVNKEVETEGNKVLSDATTLRWDDNSQKGNFSTELIGYLAMADRIAGQSYLCTSGDSYYPGYFSEIIMQDECITLKQINWHNARSSDHKQDYHMRDLEIIIPLNPHYVESKFIDHKIGNTLIHFSDRSSPKNKMCGDRILQKIEEEKIGFGISH